MDVVHTEERPEATSSSSSASYPLAPSEPTPTTTFESRTTRSSARVKAARDKPQERDSSDAASPSLSSADASSSPRLTRSAASAANSKRIRDSATKGKETEASDESITRSSKRSRRVAQPAATTGPLTINEPAKDPKGKKRALPDQEEDTISGAASSTTSNKRPRTSTSAYSLRSRDIAPSLSTAMPRKPRTSPTKGKTGAIKSKAVSAASSSRMDEDDVNMMDADFSPQASHAYVGPEPEIRAEACDPDEEHAGDEGGGRDTDDEGEGGDGDDGAPAAADGGGAPEPGAMDDAAAMAAIFGDFRQFGSYMLGMSTRLKTMLNNIKMTADPTTRLMNLQELSEILSMSTEDTLAGSFPVEGYIRELVKILGGSGKYDEEDEGDGDEDMHDEDAALAAALALSNGGNTFQGDENLEAQVLACRCLANLMEALPGVAHTIVYHGALPVLCSKLIEISYIDLAEQTLSTLQKISEEFPSAIVREGGLGALLNYLDFFSIAVQRTALQAASNCCRNFASEHFPMLQGVWPIIRNCLSYSDQRLVEFASLCIIRIVDSFHRSQVNHLEALMDRDLIKAVNFLLLPAGGSPLIATNTFTLLLRALATSARASPKITIALLEADIVDTLYQILAGVLPSASEAHSDEGGAEGGQGLGGGLADMTVMENLSHRPKDQVEEALSLLSELMPPLPKDGVFDHKSYTEKALGRLVKAKAKADRAAARQTAAEVDPATSQTTAIAVVSAPTDVNSAEFALADETSSGDGPSAESQPRDDAQDGDDPTLPLSALPVKEPAPDRTEMLRSKADVVGRFMRLTVPVLVDVYAASVMSSVRTKTLTGLLKAISFLDEDGLKQVLKCVPVASFASSVLSSKDHPSLVIGALQLVEMLLAKVPAQYKPAFLREGVFHEIESLAARIIISPKTKEKEKEKEPSAGPTVVDPIIPSPISASLVSTIPGFKKLSSLSLDPEDAITFRARVIRFKHLIDGTVAGADGVLGELRRLGNALSTPTITEEEALVILKELADLFCAADTTVSSFELLQSSVVDRLVQYATAKDWMTPVARRQQVLFETFNAIQNRTGYNALAILVKKLQESLTRMESYEVVTVSQGLDDAKRSSPSLLARQLRLRLVGEDESDIPKSLNNIVVSIHAIATFQALHDYLRPRVAGLLSGGSRLSTMLAALAASGIPPPMPSSSRKPLGDPPTTSNPATSAPAPALPKADSSSSASQAIIGRRRSQRLSAKKTGTAGATDVPAAPSAEAAEPAPMPSNTQGASQGSPDATTSEPPVSKGAVGSEMAASETLVNEDDDDLHADFTDDEVDAEVFDDVDADADNSVSEKTITVNVADDGTKVEAQTPEGTRVATPNPAAKVVPAAIARQVSAGRASYAAALKAKPTDWHLEFSMEGNVLPLDLTIYGAIHQQEMRKPSGTPLSSALIWQGIHSIKFKKVPGPAPSPEARADDSSLSRSRSASPAFASLPEDASYTKILRLLRILHKLNLAEHERSAHNAVLPETAFVNNKLTAKLTRQLEEPMIVASSCLPDWALDLPQHFPFLFPFATRYNFLQSTSFGYARLILKWQSQQTRGQDSRRDDNIAFLGRLQRQKVRISRKHILESAVKVFEMYGSSSSVLEVEYFEEVGTGLGPTLEFYSLASKEFARKSLKLWRDSDSSQTGMHVHHPHGLFPSPIGPEDSSAEGKPRRAHLLRVVGQFVAKAMLDSRIIDMSFNKVFLKLVLGEEVPLTVDSLKLVDPEMAMSLTKLRGFGSASSEQGSTVELVNIADLALDFTLPGYDIELRSGGRDLLVTADNVEEYIHEVLDAILGKGAKLQTQAFRDGFSKVFPVIDLQAFTADELVMLFGNTDEDWTIETLSEALKADHGFNVESRAIRNLVEIMSEYDSPTRRGYLQFITGSPKLPIGGFRGLNPPLTVVRKPHEAPLTADDYLPSVMTCVNYLKLPEYSSKEVMRQKLRVAMKEGVGSFHLS